MWDSQVPATWTEQEHHAASSAKAGVVFLSGDHEEQEELLDLIESYSDSHTQWLVVHVSGYNY